MSIVIVNGVAVSVLLLLLFSLALVCCLVLLLLLQFFLLLLLLIFFLVPYLHMNSVKIFRLPLVMFSLGTCVVKGTIIIFIGGSTNTAGAIRLVYNSILLPEQNHPQHKENKAVPVSRSRTI